MRMTREREIDRKRHMYRGGGEGGRFSFGFHAHFNGRRTLKHDSSIDLINKRNSVNNSPNPTAKVHLVDAWL